MLGGDRPAAADEAAEGIRNTERLLGYLSSEPAMATEVVEAVTKFGRVVSLLGTARTGHARFRHAPAMPPSPASPSSWTKVSPRPYCPVPITEQNPEGMTTPLPPNKPTPVGEAHVLPEEKAPPSSPMLSSKRKCGQMPEQLHVASNELSRCHCSKKR